MLTDHEIIRNGNTAVIDYRESFFRAIENNYPAEAGKRRLIFETKAAERVYDRYILDRCYILDVVWMVADNRRRA